jgi:hypothetical protein
MAIKSLSPHYKSIPWISPYTGLTCTSYTLELFAWIGLKTSAPIAPHFTISKNNVTDAIDSDKINISRLVSDFIDFTEQTDAGVTALLDGNNQAWVKTQVFYTTSDSSELTLPQSISVDLMVKGKTYGLDGENGDIPTNKVLIPTNNYKVYKGDGRFVVPIKLDEHASSISAANDTFNIFFQDTILDVMANDNRGWQPTNIINVARTDSLPTTAGSLSIENNTIKYNVGTVLATPITATYIIQDSIGDQSTATITVNITALPSVVTANDDFYAVNDTDVVALLVQANDVDGTAPTTITAVTQPASSGTTAIDGTNEWIIFTPNGTVPAANETFTYDLTDTLATDTGTVTLQVTSKIGGGGGSSVNMQTTGSASGVLSCAQPLATLRYHNGGSTYPTLADTIYTDSGLTTTFTGSSLYYAIPGGRSVQVDNSGVVQNLWICGAGNA